MESSLWPLKSPFVLAPVLALIFAGVAAAGADLRFVSMELTNRPANNLFHPGGTLAIRCEVDNGGDQTSDSYTIDLYCGNYHIGSVGGGPLGPNYESSTLDTTCSIPNDAPDGMYCISGELSCSNDSYSGNNQNQASMNIRVAKPVPADIVIRSVDAADGMYRPGDAIVVTICIDAVGGQLTASCDMDFYASADRTISVDDYKIGDSAVGGLNPGDSHAGDVLCRLPSNMPAGHYYIGVIVRYPTRDGSATKDKYDSTPVYVGIPSDLVVEVVDANDVAYVAGDQIVVYSLIKNVGEDLSTSYTVDYYVSTDANITSSDYTIGYVNRSGLPPSEQHSYNTTCQLPSNLVTGHYYIGIIVTCANDNDTANNTGYDATTVELVHPPGFVCGQIKYQDRDGRDHPVRYSRLDVYEADKNDNSLDDRLIAQTHTDGSGNYGIILQNAGQSGREIYVKVFAQGMSGACPGTTSQICSVKDDIFGEIYTLQSSLYPHPGNSFVIVDITAPNSGGEFMVYDSVVEGFTKAKTFFGIDLPEIVTYWPGSDDGTYYAASSGIFIGQSDRGDRDVIMHEYGHYVADVYHFAQGPVGNNPVHYWNADLRRYPVQRSNEEARNLAFRESWASLFSIATQYGDTRYPHSGDTKYQDVDEGAGTTFEVNLESDDDERYAPGEYYENMNCCALWDIFDEESSDGYLDLLSDTSLSKIWTTTREYKPDDIVDFWNSWFRNYDYEREMKYIFRNHEMPFAVPNL
jgi:hypothetical protein